jgi:hypothetical protein
MRDFIKNRIREGLLRESIQSVRVNDIEDDDLYDSLIGQANDLAANSEIGFGSAEPFGVLYNSNTGELAGATWLESSGRFTWHIIIKPEYRGGGYSKPLLDDLMAKYEQMKSYMGKDYKMVVNVVNDKLASTLLNHYGLKNLEDNGHGGMIMTN